MESGIIVIFQQKLTKKRYTYTFDEATGGLLSAASGCN